MCVCVCVCVCVCICNTNFTSTFFFEKALKFNLIASRVELMNYLIYFKGDIILYYDRYKK